MNPLTKSICNAWQWSGRHLKLEINNVGEINFLSAPSYIDTPTCELKFSGRVILMDRPAEVLTKTLIYRTSTYTARDTFDLAAVYLYDREALAEIARCPIITERIVEAASNRIALAKRLYQAEMSNVINPTSRGEVFIDQTCEIALEALREIRKLVPMSDNTRGNW